MDTAILDSGCGVEIPYNGVDEDCDGADLVDVDGDGWVARVAGGTDCDDTDAAVSPDADEACGNLVDDDCDGHTDEGCDGLAGTTPDPGGLYWICGIRHGPALQAPALLAVLLVVALRKRR